MILITPESGPEGLTDSITSVQRQLADLRSELDLIYERMKSGHWDEGKAAAKAITDLRQWLKIAVEAEVYLEKRKKEKQGIVNDFAINLDDARDKIRGRLDNLRRERERDGVP